MNERGQQHAGDDDPDGDDETRVQAHESRPGRVVFTEEGNTDAWMASDLTVDPEP